MKKMFIFSVAISLTLVSSAFSAINDDLKKALKLHDCEKIEHLLAEGATITTVDAFGHTALHVATCENNQDLVQVILSHYYDELMSFIDLQDYSCDWTALHFAFIFEYENIIDLLIQAGANQTIQDCNGLTPEDHWETENGEETDNEPDPGQEGVISRNVIEDEKGFQIDW
ncbi:ankyrin repeat domain-containing protein [bacterium]|nr:MAG: ankyrin repeat domain-containing protein [bacterium]